ncbi:MAG: hypothetical protein A2540_04730 [Sulfurimonas sp. RIFOXYD2_FULL_37_8]|nr:MAG: hypothetical protein A2540_04730 [Sulfurimonas sp. RIFOXYD2_FULL_37_8]
MNASQTYYKQEQAKKFKDWTTSGLEFLLKSRRDVLTGSQIALIEKKLLKEKREVLVPYAMVPMAPHHKSTIKTHHKMSHEALVAKLLKHQEVKFKHDSHFIYIQERSDGDYEGNVYYSQRDYREDESSIDGGICTTFIPEIAIEYFIELADDLTKRGL